MRPDVVFTRSRVAVFVDGCFWHGCSEHLEMPKSNVDYWLAKIARTRERDREADAALIATGWQVLRFWEHDDPIAAAAQIERAVRSSSAAGHAASASAAGSSG